MDHRSISPSPGFPKTAQAEKGQSLLEVALVIIILLWLLAGIVDLGRVFFTWIAIRDAAQEGATFASICPPNGPGNAQKIRDHVKATSHFPVDMSSPSITVSSGFTEQPTPGSQVYVSVTYTDFRFIMPLISVILDDGTLDIQATANDISLSFECPE